MNIQALPYDILFLISVHKTSIIYPNLKGLRHMALCKILANSPLIPLDCRVIQVLIDVHEFLIDSPV
jgi:hypothetical protein